jgi:hypothetical protein
MCARTNALYTRTYGPALYFTPGVKSVLVDFGGGAKSGFGDFGGGGKVKENGLYPTTKHHQSFDLEIFRPKNST